MKNLRFKIFCVILIIGTIFIGGCSQGESKEEAFQKYSTYWKKADYGAMYEMLSKDSKGYIDKEEFISRYENIYGGMEVKNISIELEEESQSEDEKEKIILPYRMKMDTIAGPIEFNHRVILVEEDREDKKNWSIQWDESMILPQMEEGDRVRIKTVAAKRGVIADKNGRGLAINGEIQRIGIVPQDLGDRAEEIKEKLAEIFQMDVEDINGKLEANWVKADLFVPIGALSIEEKDKILELTALPGVLAQRDVARVYPLKEKAAHLIGYIGTVTAEELKKLEDKEYSQHSKIGKTGLEEIYEEKLRAIDGKSIHIISKGNDIKETIAEKPPKDGADINLTIDANLQSEIYKELQGEKGTATAINPTTGEVLAMVSSPSYDPNGFILGLSSKQWNALNEDTSKPLLNRFSITYSPGSVFKPMTAAIGLEKGAIKANETIKITGLQWQKDASWGDYKVTRVKDIGKPVNLRDALVYSDNVYFAKSALKIGEKVFIEKSEDFGIGEEIPFSYPIRKSKLTNDKTFANEIQLADTGYGQGQVHVNLLHLNTMYTTFLNEGNMIKPILNIEDIKDGGQIWKENVLSSDTAKLIKEDLIQAIEDPQGTGNKAKIQGFTLGGKTGTAELKASQDAKGQENGLFIAFDAKQKDIMVSMLIEEVEGKGGSAYVVPKVKRALEGYLN